MLTRTSVEHGDSTVDAAVRFDYEDDVLSAERLNLSAEVETLTWRLRQLQPTTVAAEATAADSLCASLVFEQLVGARAGLPLAELPDALRSLKRKLHGSQLQSMVLKSVHSPRAVTVLGFEELTSLLSLDTAQRRKALFFRLLIECPDGVREVLCVPPLYTRAADAKAAARQDWYAQLCYDLVWSCLDLVGGELQLRSWADLQQLAAQATLTAPAASTNRRGVRVHVCANDSLSHRSEAGKSTRECCCWLTFERAARMPVVPGELWGTAIYASVLDDGTPDAQPAAIDVDVAAAPSSAAPIVPSLPLMMALMEKGVSDHSLASPAPSSAPSTARLPRPSRLPSPAPTSRWSQADHSSLSKFKRAAHAAVASSASRQRRPQSPQTKCTCESMASLPEPYARRLHVRSWVDSCT